MYTIFLTAQLCTKVRNGLELLHTLVVSQACCRAATAATTPPRPLLPPTHSIPYHNLASLLKRQRINNCLWLAQEEERLFPSPAALPTPDSQV